VRLASREAAEADYKAGVARDDCANKLVDDILANRAVVVEQSADIGAN
jgi:hypothetical protein